MYKRANRQLIAELAHKDIEAHCGVFPEQNPFIDRK